VAEPEPVDVPAVAVSSRRRDLLPELDAATAGPTPGRTQDWLRSAGGRHRSAGPVMLKSAVLGVKVTAEAAAGNPQR
jgi:hypothetical protein